ncbi:alkane monooxygenase [Legionella rubrilucens]|uniref:Alkane monooxygenase n=1 Tax=Legionella rubrilucens TaxID=458 RepID=A0A0W0XMP0_9GAMM|nr:alkane 1-monooxygenase [Legionella rubrilucens]KTD45863.1 alkane monooxygenase [Legionella rubrilucens]
MSLGKKLSFLTGYLLLLLPLAGFFLGGIYNFLAFFVLFTSVPVIDYWVRDASNAPAPEEKAIANDPYFSAIVYAYVPVQCLLLLFSVYVVSHVPLRWYEWLGYSLSIGLITGGLGITLAHELMHKKGRLQQFLSQCLLVMVCYGHFMIEHVRGHHVRVATPDDPASAPLGISVYRFIPRSIIGSFQSAWHLEKQRLNRKGYSFHSLHNQFLWIIGAPLIIAIVLYGYGGLSALGFFLLQSLVAIVLLEMVNYIEHYGLRRKRLPNGHYEPVSNQHSWNANHWLSNVILFHLQRHSDHHAQGAKPYQILRHCDESPQLPSGYLGMIMLSLVPPLWFAVMDKRALHYRQGE